MSIIYYFDLWNGDTDDEKKQSSFKKEVCPLYCQFCDSIFLRLLMIFSFLSIKTAVTVYVC